MAGATQLRIVGDLITELAMKHDGDEGLFRAYESVEFLAPLYAGDWIEARGRIADVGNTSRRCEFEIHKIGAARTDISDSAAEFLDEPILTLRAVGTTVVPKEHQRFAHGTAGHSGRQDTRSRSWRTSSSSSTLNGFGT